MCVYFSCLCRLGHFIMSDTLADSIGKAAATIGAVTAVSGIAYAYYITRSPEPNCKPTVDLNDQSYVLPDGSRCSKLLPKGELLSRLDEDVKTMYDVFQRGLSISGNEPCIGQRTGPNQEYEWVTYQQVHNKALAFGSWVLDQGYQSGRDHVLAIFSANRLEWVVSEQACSTFNFVCTALYDTLGEESVEFVINHTNLSMIVCDTVEKANKLLKIHDKVKSLKTIVVMNGTEGVDLDTATKHKISVVSFQDAVHQGHQNLKEPCQPKPEDIAVICYTSGTTGNPKGVVLTHSNIVANMSALLLNMEFYRPYRKGDVYISYLPLAHMYERLGQQMLFFHGIRIGFSRGDVKLLVDDIQTLKPTLFASVPRLLNRIYDKIMGGVQKSVLKRTLLEWGIAAKQREIKQFIYRKDSFWDKLVFKKIQAILGGRIELMVTGSAPLEAKVLTFLRCALGCPIVEGYGQTESVTSGTMTVAGTSDAGHVGPPVACNYIKLVDCPDEGYLAKDGKGEVCIKGPNVLVGYYKDPVKTAETKDKDGWLHTGDVGKWLPNGTLKIIDRKKHLFKLSQGEYIAPEKIEIVLIRSLYVAQVFVDGDSLQSYVLAVVVPDEEVLMSWAKENNVTSSFKELCEDQTVKDMILKDIIKLEQEAGLKGFEMVKDIIICPELFSVENELLTPTFKNKRPSLRRHFKEHFAALYKKLESGH